MKSLISHYFQLYQRTLYCNLLLVALLTKYSFDVRLSTLSMRHFVHTTLSTWIHLTPPKSRHLPLLPQSCYKLQHLITIFCIWFVTCLFNTSLNYLLNDALNNSLYESWNNSHFLIFCTILSFSNPPRILQDFTDKYKALEQSSLLSPNRYGHGHSVRSVYDVICKIQNKKHFFSFFFDNVWLYEIRMFCKSILTS